MAALLSFKCKNCGASVSFDADCQKMKCPHCDSLFSVFDFNDSKSVWQEQEADSIRLFECASCGGHVGVDKTQTSTACPYCDGNVVVRERVTGKRRPDYVIPFKLNKSQAVSKFKKHLGDKKLLPRVFKDDAKINECRGVYVPFWVFNAKAEIAASVIIPGGKYQPPINLTYKVKAPVKNLPVDCSEKIPNDITESLEPYDFSAAVPFMPSYLAGFYADMHDTDKNACVRRAYQRITDGLKEKIIQDVKQTYGVIDKIKNIAPHFHESSAMYALYPVWLLNVSWKNRRYTFAVNGQTGKFVGNLPCSYKQLFAMFFAILGAVFAAGCALVLLASVIMK